MIKPKIGFLPLYLELYDQALPDLRKELESFYLQIANEFEKKGIEVVHTKFCCIKDEFREAVKLFEIEKVDALITLHLAYSPSLESADVLSKTKLPIIVLDTTSAYSFGADQSTDGVMRNHGIHGVQDMCNLLIRNGKTFEIEAGHWEKSDVINRVISWIKAAKISVNIKTARVGTIGEPFQGMGDFAVDADVLRSTIGVESVICDSDIIASFLPTPDSEEVNKEIAEDLDRFLSGEISIESHRNAVQTGIAIRRWIEKDNLTAFTMNFMTIDKASGLTSVPFLEASKAMSRGIGYAGEGDVITAALVGALASVYPDTGFTEMFCPDWENDTIFLSHMGEINVNLVDGKALLIEKDFPWTDSGNPVAAIGRFKGGKAVLVNLAPGPENSYSLIVVPVQMMDVKGEDLLLDSVRGWMKPEMPISEFLSEYSRAGGTHHQVLVYGDAAKEICKFGKLMGWKTVMIK